MRQSLVVGWMGSWCLLLIVALTAGSAWAQRQATVKVRDGRSVTGEVVAEDEKTVTLLISGIRTPIARDQIDSIEFLRSTSEEYADRRAKLAENDLDGRYELAKWLYDKQAYELAEKELADLSQRFPDEARVAVLKNAVAGQLRLMQDQPTTTPPTTPRPTTPRPEPRDPAIPVGLPDDKLTMEQVNLIRVYEVDLSTKPAVIVPRDVIDDIFEKYRDNDQTPKGRTQQSNFRGAKGHDQLALIFRLKARELYPRVTVRNDPPAINAFRTQLHQNYVISYCGANGCHGDASGGNLFLFRTSPNSDPTVYTNFFILHRYETPSAYMLDRDEPTKSLLLQYGMTRELSANPHPDVPGYAPQIRLASDPRIKMITDFVGQLFKPAPNYGIDYTPPAPGKKEAPPADAAPPAAPEPDGQ